MDKLMFCLALVSIIAGITVAWYIEYNIQREQDKQILISWRDSLKEGYHVCFRRGKDSSNVIVVSLSTTVVWVEYKTERGSSCWFWVNLDELYPIKRLDEVLNFDR